MRLKFIFISVILLIAGYSAFWFQLANEAEKKTLEWIEQSEARLDGIKLFVGDVTVSGFPYKIIVEASTLNAVLPAGGFSKKSILISAPVVSVVFQPWNPSHAIIVTDYVDVVVGDLADPDLDVNFDKVKTSIIFDVETMTLNNLSSVAQKVSWNNGDENSENSHIENAEFHLRRNVGGVSEQTGFDLPISRAVFFKAENARIKEFASTVLGEQADNIKFEAFLHANEQPDYTKEGLAKWRDEGGTLSVRSFEYGSTDSSLTISGDVTLDEELKPLGAFDAEVVGIGPLFQRLSTNKNISDMARLLLKSQAQNDTKKAFPLAISMQNGQMYVGPIMIMELPSILE